MTPLLWNPDDMPSADDPSESLEQTLERLCDLVDHHVQRMDHIREVLSTFYRADLSISSVQAVLDLAVKLTPSLKDTPKPSTLVRRHLVCDCGHTWESDLRIGDRPALRCTACGRTMRVASIDLLPSPDVDVLTSDHAPF